MTQRGDVGHKENDKQIEKGYKPRVTHLIEHRSHPHGYALSNEKAHEEADKPQKKHHQDSQLQWPSHRRDAPKVPTDIPCESQHNGKNERNNFHHIALFCHKNTTFF